MENHFQNIFQFKLNTIIMTNNYWFTPASTSYTSTATLARCDDDDDFLTEIDNLDKMPPF